MQEDFKVEDKVVIVNTFYGFNEVNGTVLSTKEDLCYIAIVSTDNRLLIQCNKITAANISLYGFNAPTVANHIGEYAVWVNQKCLKRFVPSETDFPRPRICAKCGQFDEYAAPSSKHNDEVRCYLHC